MIGWLLGFSLSAGASGGVKTCEFNYPIAGSAGFANAQEARRTNAATYGAARMADAFLAERPGTGGGAFTAHATFNAARVPTLCGDGYGPVEGENRVYLEPMDLYAENAILQVGTPWVGAYYSVSVSYSLVGLRYAGVPSLLFNFYPMFAAPVIGVWQRGDGVSSYSLDYVAGAYADFKVVGFRGGYAGTRGAYLSVEERFAGLFGSTVLQPGGRLGFNYLRLGAQRVSLASLGLDEVAERVGMTTLSYRDLPWAEDRSASGAVQDTERLRTTHLEQQSIGRWVDVSLALASAPRTSLYEAAVAVHTPGYHPWRTADPTDAERINLRDEAGFLVRAGIIELPPRYDLGVEPAALVQLRAELLMAKSQPGGHSRASFALLFNDPEQLALYPFARNTLTLMVQVEGGAE
jgi:hypothetical protein